MNESVSVIIPAFRAENLLGRAVHSALVQTFPVSEVVIVSDDGADYRDVLERAGIVDARLRFVSTGRHGSGPANARNVGLDAARGRVIATLDADDMLEPRALEFLIPPAIEHGAAYGRVHFIDQTTGARLESFDRRLAKGPKTLEEILTSQIHTFAGIAFDRMRVASRWPAWPEQWEDVYFYVRCFDDLDAIWHVPEPTYRYFRVAGSICNRPESGTEFARSTERWLARIAAGNDIGLRNPASRETFRRYLRSRQALEDEYVRSFRKGEYDDFHSYVRRMKEFFHQLEIPPHGGWTPSAGRIS